MKGIVKKVGKSTQKGSKTTIKPVAKKKEQPKEITAESEEHFRLIAENVSDLIALIDINGNRLYNNPAYAKIFGNPATLRGTNSFQEIHPEDREAVKKIFDQTVKTGIGQRSEFRFLLNDGSIRFIESHGSVIQDNEGKPAKIAVVSRDITERKTQEQAIQESEQKYRTLVETMNEGLMQVDNNDTILFVNDRFCEMVGYPRSELIGKTGNELLIYEGDRPLLKEKNHLRTKGVSDSYELRMKKKNGEMIWLRISGAPVSDSTGKVLGSVGILTEITENKKLRDDLLMSQSHLRTIIETEPECVKIIDKKGRLLDMNAAGLAMIEAHSIGEVKGRSIFEVIAPEHREAFIRLTQQVSEGKKGILEFEIIGLKGTRRWLETHAVPFIMENNETVELAVTRDITERKRAEESLRESEIRFQKIFEESPIGMVIGGIDFKMLNVNKSFCSMLGYTREEFLSRSVEEMSHPDDYKKDLELVLKLIKGEIPNYNLEKRYFKKNGEILWGKMTVSVVRGKNGTPLYGIAMVENITKRKQAEEQLHLLAHTMESISEIATITDLDNRITFVNKAFIEKYGYTREEIIGQSIYILWTPTIPLQTYEAILIQTRIGGWKGETINRTKDGKEFPISLSTSVIRDSDNNIIGLSGIAEDITERKKLEHQLHQAQKMEAIGHLASGIAHDFNNVLAGILGYAELGMRKIDQQNPIYASLSKIHQLSERGALITRQLLAFSRKQIINPKDVDLSKLIPEHLLLIGKTIGEHIEIEFTSDPSLNTVHADPIQIEQVLLNLCVNARDAMPNGGKLRISTRNISISGTGNTIHPDLGEGTYILLSVSDTGTGIDEKISQKIFDPFFTTKATGKGSGLGLSMVHGIISQHNGIITVDSKKGEGTTFNIYLPSVERIAETQKGKNDGYAKGGTETILLVEDDTSVHDMVDALLTDYGYTVLHAYDGEEGLQQYHQNTQTIALIVSDIVMPRMNGKELHEKIISQFPSAKFLFISGYAKDFHNQNFVLNDGIDFLHKPFSPNHFAEKIREILDRASEHKIS